MATEGHRKQQTWNDLRPAQPVKPNFTKKPMVRDFASPTKKDIVHQEMPKNISPEVLQKDRLEKKQTVRSRHETHNNMLSKLKLISPKTKHVITSYKKRTAIIISFVLFIVTLSSVTILSTSHPSKGASTQTGLPTAPGLSKGTPSYATLLPSGKTAGSLGGWTRVSPPDRNPVFAYVDILSKTPISVSEQPLPSDFITNTDQKVQELAINYNATQKIPVGSATIYVGTSTNGPQSLIFYKNNLLILIKSAERIENTVWSSYINSLE